MNTAVHPEAETSLIEALKQGDSGAYKQAVREYSPGMLAVARFYLDHSSAEEVVQDCWVTVIDAIHKFEGRSGLKTWLHRIVANRCKNKLRASKREVATDFSESLEPELAEIASDYIDGELSGRQNLSVKMHLMMCKDCRTFIGNLRASSNLLSAHSSGRTDEEFLLRRFGLPEQIQVLTHAGIG